MSIAGKHGSRRRFSGLAIAGAIWLIAATSALAGGNNGTLKIHEFGTPEGSVNNDPKVCLFNVEGFFLDPGQAGYLVFSVQGGDAPQGTGSGPFAFGPADASGYFASEYFGLAAGHYKATLYGKSGPDGGINLADVKAKSKVFKVTCTGNEGGGGIG
jgi:hypothetical protein